ncbi:MAG: hypothetical protein WC796_06140 [Candidatus Pacearchaeota archaeon]|jgi:hypothetical protein
MYENLCGRLEVVDVVGKNSSGCAIGHLSDLTNCPDNPAFIVRRIDHLPDVLGKFQCLVQFCYHSPKPNLAPPAMPISLNIPTKFQGWPSENYFFYGFWNRNWKTECRIPTIFEINQHFGAGSLGKVHYCLRNNKIIQVVHGAVRSEWYKLRGVIKSRLPDPKKGSRFILLESDDLVEKLTEAAWECGLLPVKIEPLDYFNSIKSRDDL